MTTILEKKRALVAKRIAAALGDEIICDRCGATYMTFGERCTADLLDPCPGFNRIDEVAAPIEREIGF